MADAIYVYSFSFATKFVNDMVSENKMYVTRPWISKLKMRMIRKIDSNKYKSQMCKKVKGPLAEEQNTKYKKQNTSKQYKPIHSPHLFTCFGHYGPYLASSAIDFLH